MGVTKRMGEMAKHKILIDGCSNMQIKRFIVASYAHISVLVGAKN